MGVEKQMVVCKKCAKPMAKEMNYYTLPSGEKMDVCKKCYTMHINLREPSTFMKMFEELDMPYIETEWQSMVERYGANPKTTPTAIFGRYVAKMKLPQYSKYGFADTEKFVEEKRMAKIRENQIKLEQINKYRDALESGEATRTYEELKGLDLSLLNETDRRKFLVAPQELEREREIEEGLFATSLSEDYSMLTDEDKRYLITKWGKTFTISECLKLERLYVDMMESYDIRTASHVDYLLKICRLSLKIDQALEVNDIDGFQKMARVYDILMKSAKFTAAQNKEKEEEYADAVGKLVHMAEREGFLAENTDEREDVVEATMNDLKRYTEKLITNEMNLGNMIEVYLQKMIQEENKEEGVLDDEDDEVLMIKESDEVELLSDEDFQAFNEMLESEAEITQDMLK